MNKKLLGTLTLLPAIILPIAVMSCSSGKEQSVKILTKEELSKFNIEEITIDHWPDGDSPKVTGNTESRFSGLDTPEMHDQFNNMEETWKVGKHIEWYYAVKGWKLAKTRYPKGTKMKVIKTGNFDSYNREAQIAIDAKTNEVFSTILISKGLARIAFPLADIRYSIFKNADNAAYRYAFNNNNGFWSFIKNGDIPNDVNAEFKKQLADATEKKKNNYYGDDAKMHPYDRMKLVFGKLRRDDGSLPGWLNDYFDKNGGTY